ncbi:MAG: transketolase family protein [Candidatus Bipolaricaulota bacterium]|nr:transketolase family protein [Candidatus Bipolaricaulota bacterium]
MTFDRYEGTRDAYGKTLAELGYEDERIVVLTADLAGSTKTGIFAKAHPYRFFNVGVAEADMMGIAAGLAMGGYRPFASTFAMFATGKAWEQIRQVIAYPKVPVRIVATHAGLTVGEDGASHQMLEDISNMRVLPNMTVIVPADAVEATAVTRFVAKYDEGPVYVRLARAKFPVILPEDYEFELGKAHVLAEGSDISVFACGVMVSAALKAREDLATEGISVEVVNVSTIKPLDAETLLKSAAKTGLVVTAEEHQVNGGLGSTVCELLSENLPTRVVRVGVHDRFGQSGPADRLLSEYGLDAAGMVAAIKKALATS